MICNKCGHQFDSNFCPKCGTPNNSFRSYITTSPKPQKATKKYKPWQLVLITVFVSIVSFFTNFIRLIVIIVLCLTYGNPIVDHTLYDVGEYVSVDTLTYCLIGVDYLPDTELTGYRQYTFTIKATSSTIPDEAGIYAVCLVDGVEYDYLDNLSSPNLTYDKFNSIESKTYDIVFELPSDAHDINLVLTIPDFDFNEYQYTYDIK